MPLPPPDAATLDRLCLLAAQQVSLDPSTVTPDSDFFTDLNFDSLDTVEYIMRIEDEFDVHIPDDHAQSVRTPRQACAILAPARPAPSDCITTPTPYTPP